MPPEVEFLRSVDPKTTLQPHEVTLGYPRNFHKFFALGELLGKGAFGQVYEALALPHDNNKDDDDDNNNKESKEDGHLLLDRTPTWISRAASEPSGPTSLHDDDETNLAVKIISKSSITTVQELLWLSQEVQVMFKLRNSLNIVHAYSVYEDESQVYIVMEKCSGGNLFDRISKKGKTYSERVASHLCADILRVAQQCHDRGVVHRDIKPENFLFSHPHVSRCNSSSGAEIDGGDDDDDVFDEESYMRRCPLKMTDFGLAEKYKGKPMTEISGTPHYIAPEVIRQKYGPKCDIWSCGAVLYVLLSGRPPFARKGDKGFRPVFMRTLHEEPDFTSHPWDGISDAAKDLCRKLLTKDPRKRLSATEALNHPWIREVDNVAPSAALGNTAVQHLQLFGGYTKFKQVALHKAAELILENKSSLVKEEINSNPAFGDFRECAFNGRHSISEIVQRMRSRMTADQPSRMQSIDDLNALFDELDTNENGVLTPDEVRAGLFRAGYVLSEKETGLIMSNGVDILGDGKISRKEFLTALLDWEYVAKLEGWKDILRRVFDLFDKNGDGKISLEEMRESMPGKHHHTSESLRRAIAEVDLDRSGTIERKEFDIMMSNFPQLEAFDKRLISRYAVGFDRESSSASSTTSSTCTSITV